MTRRQRWLVLGVETLGFVALLGWILTQLDRIGEPSAWLVGLVIVIVGDLATVFVLQGLAPTSIKLEPGEGAEPVGRAIDDFDAAGRGRVLLRGERWKARAPVAKPVRAGGRVKIVAREGLTLVVEPAGERDGAAVSR